MRKIELLAPAKNIEVGKAAINSGADAVYIGASEFGARANAGNSIDDIKELVEYAHLFNVKVYVTLNTILYDGELKKAEKLIHKLYDIGVDALIIQDMGILEMDLPPIELHASTQTNNYNIEHIKFLDSVGFHTLVLARELNLEQIREIRSETKCQLEVFVNGAICVSLSGQCYLSQHSGGRSANRGCCAQPCRQKYDLKDSAGNIIQKDKYLLSMKDMNRSDSIEQLIETGVDSFKIEGRLKDIDYVVNTVSYYRQIIDRYINTTSGYIKSSSGVISHDFKPDLSKTFSRGFTDYFMSEKRDKMASFFTPKSVGEYLGKIKQVDKKWFNLAVNHDIINGDGLCFIDKKGKLNGFYVNKVENGKIFTDTKYLTQGVDLYRNYNHSFNKKINTIPVERKIGLNIEIEEINDGLKLKVVDEDNISTQLCINIIKEEAKNRERAFETIKKQLSKSGGTIFKVSSVKLNLNQPLFIPVSVLNSARRELFELHIDNRIKSYVRNEFRIKNSNIPYPFENLGYMNNVSNRLSEQFYKRHNVKSINKAFEISDDNSHNNVLMTTRYCIKYELGYCPIHQAPDNKLKEPLFIEGAPGKFQLEFDCKNCMMKIIK